VPFRKLKVVLIAGHHKSISPFTLVLWGQLTDTYVLLQAGVTETVSVFEVPRTPGRATTLPWSDI
jgi:hypothetical protein